MYLPFMVLTFLAYSPLLIHPASAFQFHTKGPLKSPLKSPLKGPLKASLKKPASSSSSTNLFLSSPSPPTPPSTNYTCKIGDFITYPDSYSTPSIAEITRITTIQPSPSSPTPTYLLTLLPLEPTSPLGYYTYSSKSSSIEVPISSVYYTPASLVRSIGIRIPMNGSAPLSYGDDTKKYITDEWEPEVGVFNESVVERDGEAYDKIKFDLVLDSLKVGLPIFLILGVKDFNSSVDYGLGLLGGLLYLSLLTFKIDGLGEEGVLGKLKTSLGKGRYLGVVGPVLYLALKGFKETGQWGFDMVSPSEFGYVVAGGLTYRLSLFGRQIGGDLSRQTVYGKIFEREEEEEQVEAEEVRENMVVVSGPRGIGVEEVVGRFMEKYNGGGEFERFDGKGVVTEGKIPVMVAGVDEAADIFKGYGGYNKIGVWVSLETLEEIEGRVGEEGRKDAIEDLRKAVEGGLFEWTAWAKEGGEEDVMKAIEFVRKL